MDETDPGQKRTTKRGRSPSYPAVPLDVAIERARVVYEKERQHPAPVDTVLDHWGYKPGVGTGLVTVAALSKFGLLESEGANKDRMVRLTKLGLDIVLNPERDDDAIRRAALMPDIHQEMQNAYGPDLPSDANLKFELVRNRGFTERGAAEFITEYKRTASFAKLDNVATIDVTAGDMEDDMATATLQDTSARTDTLQRAGAANLTATGTLTAAGTLTAVPTMTIPIPLVGSEQVQLSGQFPISTVAWDQLMNVLQALKPGLVRDDAEAWNRPEPLQ